MTLKQYLNQPYPVRANKWKLIFIISLFIAMFMVIFQPFGLQFVQKENKSLILAGYGLVTFIMLVINLIVFPKLFPRFLDEDKWTVKKQILWLLWVVFTIGIGNYYYSILVSIIMWSGLSGFILLQGFTMLIALFPIVTITIISQNQNLKKNTISAKEINKSLPES